MQGFVEVFLVARLSHVEKCSGVINGDVLLLGEPLHEQPLHCFTRGFKAKEGLGICLSTENTFEGSTCHQLYLQQNLCISRATHFVSCEHPDIVHGCVKGSNHDHMIGKFFWPSPDDG